MLRQNQLLGLEWDLRGWAPCARSFPLVLLEPLVPTSFIIDDSRVLLDRLYLFKDGWGRGGYGDLGPRRGASCMLKEVVSPAAPLFALREAPVTFCNAPVVALISRIHHLL